MATTKSTVPQTTAKHVRPVPGAAKAKAAANRNRHRAALERGKAAGTTAAAAKKAAAAKAAGVGTAPKAPKADPVVKVPEGDAAALYAEAMKRKAKGKRGKGVRLSAAGLKAYCDKVKQLRPKSTGQTERQIAYWIAGLAFSRITWPAAWGKDPEGAQRPQGLRVRGASKKGGKSTVAERIAAAGDDVAALPKAERITRAKQEHEALAAWEKAGSKGPRPETPVKDYYQSLKADSTTAKAELTEAGSDVVATVKAAASKAAASKSAGSKKPVGLTPVAAKALAERKAARSVASRSARPVATKAVKH